MANIDLITVPQWGLEMTEGTVSAWHIAVGDRIEKGCEIVDIETAKIVNTMEAMTSLPGVVRRLVAKAGDTLPVGGVLAVVADESVSEAEIDAFLGAPSAAAVAESTPAPAPASASAPASPAAECAAVALPQAACAPAPAPAVVSQAQIDAATSANLLVDASPVARRVANRNGLDLSQIQGTGRHGRVSLADVETQLDGALIRLSNAPQIDPQALIQRNEKVNASPVARRLANRHQIELTALAGTGRGGRVSVADVEALLVSEPAGAVPAVAESAAAARDFRAGPAARKLAAELGIDLSKLPANGPRQVVLKNDVEDAFKSSLLQEVATAEAPDHELIPLTPMRKAIAASLTHSKQTIPHFYLTCDLHIDALIALRQAMNAQGQGRKKLSLNDFLMRAVALALKDVPAANVHFTDAGIKQFNQVHLCVAVAIDGGLVTPVIRQAEDKGVIALSSEISELAERARNRSLTGAQLSGGTFTVSNLGMFGIRQFDAVINPPQGAILAVGSTRREAYEAESGVAFRSVMSVTLSCDHRAIDGAVGAQFLQALRDRVEQPFGLLN